jgi:hypothetical protein
MWFRSGDRDEVIGAGDAFYAPPGHTAGASAGTEFVGGFDSANSMRHFNELGELGDAGGQGTCCPRRVPGQPCPSHCSYAAPSASHTAGDRATCSASLRAIVEWCVIISSTSR